MTDFVGDDDHGDALPPSEVLFKEVLELRKQRDEARREICMILGGKGGRSSHVSPDAIDHARSRGWDCFAGERERSTSTHLRFSASQETTMKKLEE